MGGPLRDDEVRHFVDRGWVMLRNAFPRSIADEVRARVAAGLDCDFERPETWTTAWAVLEEIHTTPPYTDAVTERVVTAVDQLVGPGRWEPLDFMGHYAAGFPGFPEPQRHPAWHVDTSLDVDKGRGHHAVVALFLFSDLDAGSGGTLLVNGSHHVAAQVVRDGQIADESQRGLGRAVLPHLDFSDVTETTGSAGDVVLFHALLMHAAGHNSGSSVRLISNPRVTWTNDAAPTYIAATS